MSGALAHGNYGVVRKMKREEVMAMTDDQLRIKAAELMGIVTWEQDGDTYLVHDTPDYTNDIAAAWELWMKLEADGFIVSLENGTSGRGKPIISVRGTGDNKMFDTILRGDEKKIITRAFILASEENHE